MLIKQEKTKNVNTYIGYFKKNTNQSKPLAKLFKTDSTAYVYDTGTSKVMSCEKYEYKILEKIINGKISEISDIKTDNNENEFYEALKNVKQAIENEDILKAGPNNVQFASSGHFENLYEKLDSGLDQMVLELTEKCNLRCGYCIYNDYYEGKRNFGNADMTREIARRSIEYAKEHGNKARGVSITFYGGEPLLNFDLLKYSIEYSKKIITDRKIHFSMTTNLTLMTEEIAKYLASVEELSIVCSIDGPEDIQNTHRKDMNGVGSFSRAIKGLKILVQALDNKVKERMSLSMVFAMPYYDGKLEKINNFFDSLDWLPKGISKFITYPSVSNIDYEKENNKQKNEILNDSMLTRWSKEKYAEGINNNGKEFFTKQVVESPLTKIQKRPIFKKCNNNYYLNGCCIPGSRKIYVTVKGDFLLCERIDGSPVIGNVFDGLDKEKIKSELIDEYSKASISDCSKCWGARLCNVCYSHCYNNGKLDMNKKKFNCDDSRQYMLSYLIFYHKCLESNPKALEYINDIKVM